MEIFHGPWPQDISLDRNIGRQLWVGTIEGCWSYSAWSCVTCHCNGLCSAAVENVESAVWDKSPPELPSKCHVSESCLSSNFIHTCNGKVLSKLVSPFET